MAIPQTLNPAGDTPNQDLIKGLGLFDSSTLVMGSMIGSGIFIVAAEIGREVASPSLLMLTWIVGGFMTVSAAVSYGELAGMMPRAGGQYVYLREAFGPLSGFLYGWTLFLVIQTGTLAAVAVAFGKFLGVFAPWVSAHNILVNLGTVDLLGHPTALTFSSQQLIAVLALAFLTFVNAFGLRTGSLVQNVFTILKIGALLGLISLGVFWVATRHPQPPTVPMGASAAPDWHWGWGTLMVLATAMVGPLFSSDAWNNVTFTGAEVINPKRNLPLALFFGTATVCLVYVACNWVYLRVLPFYGIAQGLDPLTRGIQHAAEDRVATAAVQVMVGPKAVQLMAGAIMVSTFGCMNGLILAGARVYYAMAKDGLFFSAVGRVHPRYHSPVVSLVVQGAWAALLTLSGTYNDLLDYVIFAVLLFYILTVLGIFRLRRTQPDAPRPYKAWGYPVLPAAYILLALIVEWALLTHKPLRSLAGLAVVGLGLPVFYAWRRKSSSGVV